METPARRRRDRTAHPFSSSKVRPASIAMTRTFASAAMRTVSVPITGTSKRMSWFGLATLTMTASLRANSPPRLIASFVPSNASTASDGAVLHDHGLTDIEPADFPRDFKTVSRHRVLRVGINFRPAIRPGVAQAIVEKGGGRKQFDTDSGEFIGDGGENCFGIPLLQSREQQQRFPIRPQIEKILRRDLAGHDGMLNAGARGRNRADVPVARRAAIRS